MHKKYCRMFLVSILLILPSLLHAGDMKAVSVGASHSLVLKADGSLWAFGRNQNGQIGNGTKLDCKEPVKIMDNVVQISAQYHSSMAVKADGSLWVWGNNIVGQLGNGTVMDCVSPVKIMDNVKFVCAGLLRSFAVDRNGNLWAWGQNMEGQLGDGTTINRLRPVKIMSGVKEVSGGDNKVLILCEDGSLFDIMRDFCKTGKTPRKIMDNVCKVSCYGTNMALRNDGTLWTWGSNNYGNLGDGTTTSHINPKDAVKIMDNVCDISSGAFHAMAVCNDGTLWAWGDNESGQLGDGTTTERHSPVKVDKNVESVSCGARISAWITRNGELRMVGMPFIGK